MHVFPQKSMPSTTPVWIFSEIANSSITTCWNYLYLKWLWTGSTTSSFSHGADSLTFWLVVLFLDLDIVIRMSMSTVSFLTHTAMSLSRLWNSLPANHIKPYQTYIFPLHNFTFAVKILHKDHLFYGVSMYLNLYIEMMKWGC